MKTKLEKIKAKLKKLFALSRSPNASEAALALEMAQKLMMEHGIKRNDVGEFEVIEEDVKGSGNKRPPKYEAHLVSNIAMAFGCQSAYGWNTTGRDPISGFFGYSFVGLEHRVQIACFVAEVLLRKLKKARNEYLKRLTRTRSRINKMKKADEFCLGWSCAVVDKLNEFTNTPDEQEAIDIYVSDLKWGNNLKTISRGAIRESSMGSFLNGRRAAAGVEIQSGIEGGSSGALLLGAVL